MLIVQKYNSLSEIDSEFKDAIEGLVSSEIPSFAFLERAEKIKPPQHVFYYYLFFGHVSNMPVGFACFELVNLPEKEFVPLMERMMNKMRRHEGHKWLRIAGPGKLKNFFFFEPKQLKLGLMSLTNIVAEMKARTDVVAIEEWAGPNSTALLPQNEKKLFKETHLTIGTLKKIFTSYEDYFKSLPTSTSQKVKAGWKTLTRDGIFWVKETVDVTKLPPHDKLAYYLGENIDTQAIEDEDGVVAVIVYILTKNNNMHVDFVFYKDDNRLTPMMLLQSALMKFFDHPSMQSLNFLTQFDYTVEEIKDLGLPAVILDQSLEAKNDFVAGVLTANDLRRYS